MLFSDSVEIRAGMNRTGAESDVDKIGTVESFQVLLSDPFKFCSSFVLSLWLSNNGAINCRKI